MVMAGRGAGTGTGAVAFSRPHLEPCGMELENLRSVTRLEVVVTEHAQIRVRPEGWKNRGFITAKSEEVDRATDSSMSALNYWPSHYCWR